jgi:hypothetical protein
MELDIKKISKAWFNSYFGSNEQKELSQKRLNICEGCPERTTVTIGFTYPACGICSCPIQKKIFSSQFNDCPLDKWENVDKEHPILFKKKLL